MMPEPNEIKAGELETDDCDALFRLITEEIKDLNETDKLQGWTPWVLSATLISMIWIIVQDLWNSPLLIAQGHAAFLVVSLVLLVIMFVRGTFNAMSPDRQGRGPFLFIHTSVTALNAFVMTLWMGTIAVACFTLNIPEGGRGLLLAGICFSIFAVAALTIVLAIATRLPLPVATGGALKTVIFGSIISTICIVVIINILKTNTLSGARLSDIRAGGLLALGAYVLVLLSRGGASHPIVKKTLAELRRDLVLGSLPLEEAIHRTRVTLQGLWLSDVVRDDMRALLKFISDVRALYDDAFRKIDALKVSIPISAPAGAQLVDFEKVVVSNTLDVLKTYEERVNEISERYHAGLRNVKLRLAFASRLVKSASSDHAKLIAEVKLAQGPADAALKRFVREFLDIQNAWNLWYPAEARHHKPFGLSEKDVG